MIAQGITVLLWLIGAVLTIIALMAVILLVVRIKEVRRQLRAELSERRAALTEAREAYSMVDSAASSLRHTLNHLNHVRKHERMPVSILADLIREMDSAEAHLADLETLQDDAAATVEDELSNDSLRELSDKYGLINRRLRHAQDALQRCQWQMNSYETTLATTKSRILNTQQSSVRHGTVAHSGDGAVIAAATTVVASTPSSLPDSMSGSAVTTCGE